MNKLGESEILICFPYYVNEYKRLEAEYYRLHSWQHIKQFRNLHQRHKLTKWYEGKMREWEL